MNLEKEKEFFCEDCLHCKYEEITDGLFGSVCEMETEPTYNKDIECCECNNYKLYDITEYKKKRREKKRRW